MRAGSQDLSPPLTVRSKSVDVTVGGGAEVPTEREGITPYMRSRAVELVP